MIDFTRSVVHVRSASTGGSGAGVLVAPDLVVTAAHPVWSSLLKALVLPIQVSQDGTFLDAIETKVIGFNKITDIPKQNVVDNERDIALLQLATPISDLPLMGFEVDYPGGVVTITGFPGGGGMQDIAGARIVPQPGTENDAHRAFKTPFPEPGYSGGPLWVNDLFTARVVGIVSSHSDDNTSGIACALTRSTMRMVETWLATINRCPAIARLYRTLFDREPDKEGNAFWCAQIARDGMDVVFNEIVKEFTQSPEYAADFAGKPPADIIASFYLRALGRAADAGGLAYWVAQPLVNAIVGITQDAEAMTYGSRFPI